MVKSVLFKNLQHKHLEEFKADGTVLLSSFSRCRVLEGHAGDPLEGIKGFQFASEDYVSWDNKDLNKMIPDVNFEGEGFQRFKNINVRYSIPNAYLFCVSINVLPFYESHYKIINTLMFGNIVFESLRDIDNQVYFWKLDRVIYGGLKDPIINPEHLKHIKRDEFKYSTNDDYFQKPSKFSGDDEYRFVFFTKSPAVPDFTIIHNRVFISHCSFD